MLAYAKEHAAELHGLLFYKVDRAARNLFDYVELERLESEHGLPFITVSQPTENTPAGRMQRRMLANVREGHARRVQNGLFVQTAPFGYRNYRKDGRGLVDVHPENGPKVQRIFHLYAYQQHTLDSLLQALADEGVIYSPSSPRFTRSKLYAMLRDRSYIGEVKYQGQWFPGTHEPLVDRTTWDRVQAILGGKVYRCTGLTYAGELITRGSCGHPITGECKTKRTKSGEKDYVYYRCSHYNAAGHPRVRLREGST